MSQSFDVWRFLSKAVLTVGIGMVIGWTYEQGYHGAAMFFSAVGGIWVWEMYS